MKAAKEHPYKAAAIGAPLAVAGAGVTATATGFGAAGIAYGSIAAGIQSGIGNVAVGSLFATMQSLGATGWFASMTTGGLAASAGSAAVVAATSTSKSNETLEKEEEESKSSGRNENENCASGVESSCKNAGPNPQKYVGSKAMIDIGSKKLLVFHDS